MLVTHMLTLRVKRASITHSDTEISQRDSITQSARYFQFTCLNSPPLDRIGPVEVNRRHTCLNMQSLFFFINDEVMFLPSTKERH